MERLIAGVVEDGDRYRIQYVGKNDEKFIRTDSLYVNVSNVAFQHIENALKSGRTIFIPKNLMGENEITFTDLVYEDKDELTNRKNIALVKERRKFDYQLALLSALSVANFVMINNEFMSEGIFITEENRDEIYLDIVTSGDEEKIDKLSRYLEYMDDIKRTDFVRKRFNAFEKKMWEIKTIEELESFLETYYSKEK